MEEETTAWGVKHQSKINLNEKFPQFNEEAIVLKNSRTDSHIKSQINDLMLQT